MGKSTITAPEIKAGASALLTIDKPAETGVKQIAVAVKNTVRNISIVVTKAAASGPALTDKTFGYIQIDKANITDNDISSVSIDFDVDKAWLNANSIDKANVVLNRLVGTAWTALSTKQTAESNASATYRAESPGLSVFAITGKVLVATPLATPLATPAATPRAMPVPLELPRVVQDYGLWIIAFIIIAIVLGYLYYHHEHARKLINIAQQGK